MGSRKGSLRFGFHPALMSFVSNSFMQQDELSAPQRERLAPLEQENALLRSQLDDCQRSHSFQAQLAALEKDYAAQLAQQARQLAVAREQEQAAQARAAKLAKANEALASTSERLAEQPDLSAFLSHIALETIAQLGADAAMLSILDQRCQVLRAVAHVEQGQMIPLSPLATEMPVNAASFVNVLLETRKPRYFNLEQEAHLFWQGSIDYHHQRQHKAIIGVPLFAGGNFLGHLGLAFTHTDPIKEQDNELLYALAQQASLAIQLTQLAEEAKQAAIAREQEQAAQARAAELEKANVALRDAIAGLAHLNDLDQFLSQMLKAALKVSGAHSGAVVLIEGDFVRHAVLFEKAGLVSSSDQAARGLLRTPFSPELCEMTQRILESEDAWMVYPDESIHPPSFQQFHREQGNRAIRLVPMRIGDHLLGWLGLGFAEDDPPLGSCFTLLRTLAQQMTVAVEMLRLAEEAKQAAIAREQEKAAHERAAELVKANDALKQTVDVMVRELNLDNFLAQVLLVVNQHLEAPGSMLWLYDFEAGLINLHLACLDGVIYRQELPAYGSSIHRTQFPIAINGDTTHLVQGTPLITIDLPEIVDPDLDAGTRQWLRDHNVISVLRVPLFVGERVIGNLTIHKEDSEPFPVERVELAKALGQQAALSIHVTQLAEEAKQAAIAREQEQAALERLAELAKANAALQQTTDALGTVSDFDEFVPAVLQIFAQAFGITACGYFEHFPNELIYLRYWFSNGRVLNAMELQLVDPKVYPTLRVLADGFTVTPEHLHGTTVRDRTRPVVLDHRSMTVTPDFHRFAVSQGWDFELNQPLVIDGKAEGSVVLFRSADQPFTDTEIALSETLAKPLALALQAKRLAIQTQERAVETAIAREQEKAAQQRTTELAKANQAMQRILVLTAKSAGLNALLGNVLQAIAEQFDAPIVEWWESLDEFTVAKRLSYLDGQLLSGTALLGHHGVPSFTVVPETIHMEPLTARTTHVMVDDMEQLPYIPEEIDKIRAWYIQHGTRKFLNVPVIVDDRCIGALVVFFPADRDFSEAQVEFGFAMARYVGLAVVLSTQAEEAKQAAIAREQEQAAQKWAAELVKVNNALRCSIDALIRQPSIEAFMEATLQSIAEVLEVPSVTLWKLEGSWVRLQLVYQDGLVLPAHQTDHPNATTPAQSWPDYRTARGLYDYPSLHQVDDPASQFTEAQRAMFHRLGVRSILAAPIVISDRSSGIITARLTHEMPDPAPIHLELVNALSNQAALALQMSQLAEEAKQAAIAQEQEKAAQKRAAELVKANEALQAEVIVRQRAELALRESERRFRAIYEQAAVGIAITSLNGRWLQVNERFCDIVGYTQSELLSLTFQDITVPEAIPADLDAIPRLISGELHQRQVEKQYIRKDGSLVWVYLTISVARDDAGAAICFIVIIQDIRQRKRAELVSEGQKLALQRTLDFLATEPELDRFLGQVLITVTQQLGASIADLWLNDVDRDLTWLYLTCQYGQILAAADQPNHPGANPVRISDFHHRQSWQCLNVQHETYIYYDVCNHPCEALRSWAIAHDGVQMVLLVPLVLGDRHLGTLMIGERENRLYQAEELELAKVLAQQVVLAIQLTRLAEEARQTAIAREQEQAARERAGELVKANEVLRRSVNALNTQPSIEAFLSITLHSIATVLQVPYACLWHYEGEWAYLQWIYQDEAVLPAAKSSHPNATQPIALGNDAYDPDRRLHTRPYYYATNDPINALPLKHRAMFQQLGVRCLLVAPIAVGDQAIGSISIRITHDMPDPTPIQIELVSTLANQAALAIQMADLAEQAKQTALLEERTRLAGEIHDTLAQAFTGISIQLGVAQRIEDHNPGEVKQILSQANALAQKGLAEARRSVWALYPDAAEYKDLVIALPRCIRQLATHADVTIEVEIHGTPYLVSAMVGMNLLRVGQEAVLNALNHANAKTIWVDLDFESDQVCLKIRDDGRGFVLPTDDCGVSGGFGLLSMNQRTERIGGRLTIISELERGTEIVVQVPFSL
ncbi:MAG: GAF domain-containing protein [Leptolyngbya sp. BL-A-14]